jgi:hypothetical protein
MRKGMWGKAERLVVKSRPLLAVCRRGEILFLSSDPGNRHVEVSLIDISGRAIMTVLMEQVGRGGGQGGRPVAGQPLMGLAEGGPRYLLSAQGEKAYQGRGAAMGKSCGSTTTRAINVYIKNAIYRLNM